MAAWAGCEMMIDPAATVVVDAASIRSASRRLSPERGDPSTAAMTSRYSVTTTLGRHSTTSSHFWSILTGDDPVGAFPRACRGCSFRGCLRSLGNGRRSERGKRRLRRRRSRPRRMRRPRARAVRVLERCRGPVVRCRGPTASGESGRRRGRQRPVVVPTRTLRGPRTAERRAPPRQPGRPGGLRTRTEARITRRARSAPPGAGGVGRSVRAGRLRAS